MSLIIWRFVLLSNQSWLIQWMPLDRFGAYSTTIFPTISSCIAPQMMLHCMVYVPARSDSNSTSAVCPFLTGSFLPNSATWDPCCVSADVTTNSTGCPRFTWTSLGTNSYFFIVMLIRLAGFLAQPAKIGSRRMIDNSRFMRRVQCNRWGVAKFGRVMRFELSRALL